MRRARLAACRSIVDAFANEAVEAVDREAAPGDARGENDRARPDDITPIEKNLSRLRIDARDGARDQNLRPQSARLLQGPARELIAGDAVRKAEIVLDPRRRAG